MRKFNYTKTYNYKIPKISPSTYKPHKTHNTQNPPLKIPPKYEPPGVYTWQLTLNTK